MNSTFFGTSILYFREASFVSHIMPSSVSLRAVNNLLPQPIAEEIAPNYYAGDNITDGDRVLKIIRRVEKITPFMDYGMTGREPPNDQSYFEYIDDNGLAGEIYDGDMRMFAGISFKKYPVVI